jgi:hypothetical protein
LGEAFSSPASGQTDLRDRKGLTYLEVSSNDTGHFVAADRRRRDPEICGQRSTTGVIIHTVGVILMIVGGVGAILSLLWMTMWDRRERVARRPEVRTYDDPDLPPAHRV